MRKLKALAFGAAVSASLWLPAMAEAARSWR
jgi:hypothetical protein